MSVSVVKQKLKKTLVLIIFVSFCFIGAKKTHASPTDGTIPADSYAWGENLSWINFGLTAGNIHITNTAITGFAWSQNYGWINFSPTNGGVTNNTSGTLGGNAWASGLGGWIPFDGVTINSSGKFTGTAGITGSGAGRISFDCTNCNVVTDWRPSSTTTSTTTTTTTAAAAGAASAISAPIATPIPFTVPFGEIVLPTGEATPSALFDIAAQPMPSTKEKNNLTWLMAIILVFLLVLLYFASKFYQKIKRQKLEKVKRIKKLK